METASLCAGGLVKVNAAAEFLGLSRSKVYQLMDRGQLPFVLIGRSRRIPKHALPELAARNLIGGDSEIPE